MEPRDLCTMAFVGRDALALARHLAEMAWAAGLTATLERRLPALWEGSFSAARLDFGQEPSAYPVRPLDVLVCLSHPLAALALFTVDRATALVYDPDTCGAAAGDFAVAYPVPLRRLARECGAGDQPEGVGFGALAGLFCGPELPARLLLAGQGLARGEPGRRGSHGELAGLCFVERHVAKRDPWRLAAPEVRDGRAGDLRAA